MTILGNTILYIFLKGLHSILYIGRTDWNTDIIFSVIMVNIMGIRENLKRGTVEMLILFLLQEQDMYGYELSKALSDRSNGLYEIQEGSMYPTLYRLIEKKYISDHKELIGKRRTRVYYHIEESGREYLKEIVNEYQTLNNGINMILSSNEE